jgi:superfamily II DNA or RNA helicase
VELWDHQVRAIEAVESDIAAGCRRICLQLPTGGGKTVIACELIDRLLEQGLKVVLYTNRKLLLEQLSGVLKKHGLTHGIRASGYQYERHEPLQISMLQTESTRSKKAERLQGEYLLHDAQRVIVDEAHANASEEVAKILARHREEGAACLGLTATPLGIGHLYDKLLCGGTLKELRDCGALVLAKHFGPTEPDLKKLKGVRLGEDLSAAQQRQVMPPHIVWGQVFPTWKKLNPDARPAILFAPGVKESIFFAEQFTKNGVRAAHIDGDAVWCNGKFYKSSPEAREEVLAESRDGLIAVLCNRYVLREGIDAPWLYHGILATVFGSLQSYLQSCGRLLRAHPGLDYVVIQDHGGSWHRHDSVNVDREWRLDWTGPIASGLREDRLRHKAEREPVRCPQCDMILSVRICPNCGYEVKPGKRSRFVLQLDGTLKEMHGDIYRPHRISQAPDGPAKWKKMYYRARSQKWDATFRQAEAMFAVENNWDYPDRSWPFMPRDMIDFHRKVREVPMDRLIQPEASPTPATKVNVEAGLFNAGCPAAL